jgi:hypothetical protein
VKGTVNTFAITFVKGTVNTFAITFVKGMYSRLRYIYCNGVVIIYMKIIVYCIHQDGLS